MTLRSPPDVVVPWLPVMALPDRICHEGAVSVPGPAAPERRAVRGRHLGTAAHGPVCGLSRRRNAHGVVRALGQVSVAPASTVTLDDRSARELPELAVPWQAAEAPEPMLVVLNEPLAAELGLDPASLRSPEGARLLVGNDLPRGASPVAQAYAGHQFGWYSPRLGDGRALLLGEVVDVDGRLRDLHLKGSGRTPFSRGGDGLAALGPMLREYVISESMHALGIPTTRSLAVVATGRPVLRETELPGAVLARV